MEHHSNIVPWQMLCEEKGAVLRVIPINDAGRGGVRRVRKAAEPRTRLVAVSHVSNALGTINPVREIINMAHRWGVPVLIDGAQAVPHMKVDVRDLDAISTFSPATRCSVPPASACCTAREQLLEAMPPYQGGGDMIRSVTFEKTTYNDLPYKFEAGTPDIAGVIGLGAAIDYLDQIGMDADRGARTRPA